MANKDILKKIGMKENVIKKHIKNDKLDIESLEVDELLEIVSDILEKNRDKLIETRDKIKSDEENLKQKEKDLAKQIKELREKLQLEFQQDREKHKLLLEDELKKLKLQKESELNIELEKKKIKFELDLQKEKEKLLKEELDKFKKEVEKLSKKQQQLIKQEQELFQKEELFKQEKNNFESSKKAELDNLQQKLKLQEEEFLYKQKENELKKLEEVNKKIEKLYEKKENELKKLQQFLSEKEIDIQTQTKQNDLKEKELIKKEQELESKVDELIKEKIKSYEAKIEILEEEINILREDRDNYIEELNQMERAKDLDLLQELDEKKEEIAKLKKELDSKLTQKNEEIANNEKHILNLEQKNEEILEENNQLRIKIAEVERLENENRILEEKLKNIEILKGENEELRKKLEAIYSTGKEVNLRIEDIKKEPYKKDRLQNSNPIEDEIKWLENISENMEKYGVKYPKRLLYAFHTAIKSADFSPISVLAGVSGTGKSELPKLYSYFGGFNFLAEAVQPNWDSPESMLGYYNTLESKFDATNILKFLIQTSISKDENEFGLKESMNMILLDEMNLSHIELYFAEFLSKFEQRRGSKNVNLDIKLGAGMNYKLLLDKNVLWIGTMNEDETTKALSDKVLDRSFVINFPRPEKLLSRNKLITLDEIKEFEYLKRETWDSWIQKESLFVGDKKEILNRYKEIANQINKILAPTGRAIGHRVWQSMEFYINNHPEVINSVDELDKLNEATKIAFEEQLVQKIMPKLRGIETHGKEKRVLEEIKNLLANDEFKIIEDFEIAMNNPYDQFIWASANYLKEN